MSNPSKKNQRTNADVQRAAVANRRSSARRRREQQRQRVVITVVASTIGVALLALLIGVLYDQVYLPSRPVAQVASTTLSRSDYTAVRRQQIARDVNSTIELLTRFGSQLGDQFAQRIPQLNAEAEARTLRAAPVDDPTVNEWADERVIERGATALNIQANDGEAVQLMVSSLNQLFPPTAPVTGTAVVTPTAAPTLAPTSVPTTASKAISATATITPTPTIAPTETPVPTPLADAALAQEDAALRRLYDAYTSQIVNAKPSLSIDDFRAGLRAQYRRQALTDKIQAQLVKEDGFTVSTDPTSIETSHILVKVEVPANASEADRNAAFDKRKADAETILREIKGGADFATVAKAKSEDLTTKEKGGLLAGFDKTGKTQDGTQVDPAFLVAALKLTTPKQVAAEVVRTPFGWHIIQLESRTVPTKEDQLRDARSKAFDTWLQEQRTASGVQRFPAQTPTATTAPTAENTQPLPTAPLGGVPTVISDTTSLTTTNTLQTTPTAVPTAIGTTAATAAATTGTTPVATAAATAAP